MAVWSIVSEALNIISLCNLTYLFIYSCPLTENNPTTNYSSQEAIQRPLFSPICPPKQDHDQLVETCKFHQIERVILCGCEDEAKFLTGGAPTEEEGHYEGVWKPDFGSIYCSISSGLVGDEG